MCTYARRHTHYIRMCNKFAKERHAMKNAKTLTQNETKQSKSRRRGTKTTPPTTTIRRRKMENDRKKYVHGEKEMHRSPTHNIICVNTICCTNWLIDTQLDLNTTFYLLLLLPSLFPPFFAFCCFLLDKFDCVYATSIPQQHRTHLTSMLPIPSSTFFHVPVLFGR